MFTLNYFLLNQNDFMNTKKIFYLTCLVSLSVSLTQAMNNNSSQESDDEHVKAYLDDAQRRYEETKDKKIDSAQEVDTAQEEYEESRNTMHEDVNSKQSLIGWFQKLFMSENTPEEDSIFRQLPNYLLIKKECLKRPNDFHCKNLETYLTCAKTQPSEEKFFRSLKLIRENNGNEKNVDEVVRFSHCVDHEHDWKGGPGRYWSTKYHVKGILEKEYSRQTIKEEKYKVIEYFKTLQAECHARE
jgi:hypothetical protein